MEIGLLGVAMRDISLEIRAADERSLGMEQGLMQS